MSRYYWRLVNYAQATRDTDELDKVARDCDACDGGRARLERIFLRGGTVVGGRHSVRSAVAYRAPGGRHEWLLDQRVHTAAERVTGAGSLDGQYRAGTLRIFMTVAFGGAGMVVTSWHVESR